MKNTKRYEKLTLKKNLEIFFFQSKYLRLLSFQFPAQIISKSPMAFLAVYPLSIKLHKRSFVLKWGWNAACPLKKRKILMNLTTSKISLVSLKFADKYFLNPWFFSNSKKESFPLIPLKKTESFFFKLHFS